MSQNDFNIANQGFPSFRSDLNSALQALASNSAGTSAPATTYAYMWWYDSTNNTLKMRNADNDAWIDFASFDQANDRWSMAGSGDTGIYFDASSDALLPWNTDGGVTRDAAINLGSSSARFKNLYLSGGVYLGGTGAANLLDDYEEGTWTPTFGGFVSDPTASYGDQVGTYVKIGKLVFVTARIGLTSVSGGSGVLTIKGLPFTVSSLTAYVPPCYIGYKNSFTGSGPDYGRFSTNNTRMEFYDNGNTTETAITTGNLTSTTEIIVAGCYEIA